jgi:hypothetical protein
MSEVSQVIHRAPVCDNAYLPEPLAEYRLTASASADAPELVSSRGLRARVPMAVRWCSPEPSLQPPRSVRLRMLLAMCDTVRFLGDRPYRSDLVVSRHIVPCPAHPSWTVYRKHASQHPISLRGLGDVGQAFWLDRWKLPRL